MMLQRATSPDESEAAIARLTPKERECLDRWLGHATAKQIALDLGITHHAVEKRLKSARSKLGVSTTLDAARLLASVEDYGRTVSHAPEVGSQAGGRQVGAAAALLPWWKQRRGKIAIGALLMSLLLASALLFTQLGASETPQTIVVDTRNAPAGAVDGAFDQAFARLDRNGSGFLEGAELPSMKVRTIRVGADAKSTATVDPNPIAADSDKDGKVSRAEYRLWLNDLTTKLRANARAGQ